MVCVVCVMIKQKHNVIVKFYILVVNAIKLLLCLISGKTLNCVDGVIMLKGWLKKENFRRINNVRNVLNTVTMLMNFAKDAIKRDNTKSANDF